MKLPRLFAILLLVILVFPSVFGQSRNPEMKFSEIEHSDKKDTLGLEERPYFLLIGQSEEALANHDYEAAGLRLVEAMGIEPHNPLNVALLSNLGMIYYYNEQDSLALVTLNVAVERAPKLIGAHENRARVLIGMGRDAEAYDEYGTIIGIDSLNCDARFTHGMMALYRGDLPTAKADFAVLDRIVPLWSKTLLANATMYAMTGNDVEAASLYRRLLDKDKLPEYYSALAGCLISLDNLDEAGKVIGEGLARFSSDPELYYYRALLNHKRYLPQEAHADAKKAIELGANRDKVLKIFQK